MMFYAILLFAIGSVFFCGFISGFEYARKVSNKTLAQLDEKYYLVRKDPPTPTPKVDNKKKKAGLRIVK